MKSDKDFTLQDDILNEMFDGVYFIDSDRRITYWNKSAEQLTGYKPKDVIGKRCCDNILVHVDSHVSSLCEENCPLVSAMTDGVAREQEVYLRHKDGHRIPSSIRTKPIKNAEGKIVGAVEVFRNKQNPESEHQRITELEQLALLDPLTRLANRRHIESKLKTRFEEMARYKWSFGILIIDIDSFKAINDTYGHQAGDRVLKLASKTMMSSLRPFDFLGRWGGDEFISIIVNVDKKQLLEIADRMRKLVAHSKFDLGEDETKVTISVGATLAKKSDTMEQLIERADQLLYQCKKSGRNRKSSAAATPVAES
ncbi:MAG: sensor domain-containing diguanylate cyclase [Proteobacteria bacterium]|nr:sensor domain-containing diguanylate cyclase [Pseudomonadota bacterium]